MAIPCIDTYDNIRFKVITVTAKDRKQLFINDRLNKLWYIHPIESYAAKKGNRFLIPYIQIFNGEGKGQSKVYVQFIICVKSPCTHGQAQNLVQQHTVNCWQCLAPGRGSRSQRWERPFILNHFCILSHGKSDVIKHFCLIFSNELIIHLTNYNDNF